MEEDSKGRNLLPIGFLRHLIGFYDDSLQSFLPRYLEVSMENFARNQEQIRGYVEETFGRFFPVAQFEDMARQNMALFQRAASMFRPPYAAQPGGEPAPPGAAAEEHGEQQQQRSREDQQHHQQQPVAATTELSGQMRELESRLESLQRQLEQLSRERPAPPPA